MIISVGFLTGTGCSTSAHPPSPVVGRGPTNTPAIATIAVAALLVAIAIGAVAVASVAVATIATIAAALVVATVGAVAVVAVVAVACGITVDRPDCQGGGGHEKSHPT